MESKSGSAKSIVAVGIVCLIAGILLGMLIMKVFYIPKKAPSLEVPPESMDVPLNPPGETRPVDIVSPTNDNIEPGEPGTETTKPDSGAEPTPPLARVPIWDQSGEPSPDQTAAFSTTYVDAKPESLLSDFDNLEDYIPNEGTYRMIIDGCVVYMTVQDVMFNPQTVVDDIYNGVYVVLYQYQGTTLIAEEDGYVNSMSISSDSMGPPPGDIVLSSGTIIYSDGINFYLEPWTGPVFVPLSSEIYTEEEIAADLVETNRVYSLAD